MLFYIRVSRLYDSLILQIAMRWRTEEEVKLGKGQFVCGHKKCSESEMMRTWEVNFAYLEAGEKKNALVKVMFFETIIKSGGTTGTSMIIWW